MAANVGEPEGTDRLDFENVYFSTIAEARKLCDTFYKENTVQNFDNESVASGFVTNSNPNNFNAMNTHLKIPTINIPIFNGDYKKWFEFKELFVALIEENPILTPIQKFIHLKTSLGEEPLKIIKNLDILGSNYTSAWKLLTDRYENKVLMIQNHIKGIFDAPSINKESYSELRSLFDTINDHLHSLETLGEEVKHWDRLIIFILTQKFDNYTRRGWESYKSNGSLPTMSDMHAFLTERCSMLEKLANHKTENAEKHQNIKSLNKIPNKRSISHNLVSNTSEIKCYFCTGKHAIYKCPEFLKLSVNKRISESKTLNFYV